MKKLLFISFTIVSMIFVNCSYPVTSVKVQSYEAKSTKLTIDEALDAVTKTFVKRGFDIKMSDRDVGLITTEYKKFASIGEDPPFDMLMQIKAMISENGKVNVELSPIVKEQNRINAAAFSENELLYYTGDPENVSKIETMREGGWQKEAQIIFMNVVNDVAQNLGISVEEVKKNVTKTQKQFTPGLGVY